ncbi:MAG: 5'/3'-nucleotidase SurE [Caulobacteraceae bacterium]
MRILLTNDDGIGAEGLQTLIRIADRLSDDVWVCAPEVEQSGASRRLTLTEPVRVRQLSAKTFAVSGTPTDCVMLAIQEMMPDGPPDLVLSGVNRGQNMGEDVTFSGTVAGALQGMALGVPSIALSQVMSRFHDTVVAHYETAEHYAPGLISRLIEIGWPPNVVMNLNFPACPPSEVAGVEVTVQGFRDEHPLHFEKRTDLRGRDYYWMAYRGRSANPPPGTDVYAVKERRISATPLHIDLTHRETVHDLRGQLGGAVPVLRAEA